MYEFNRSDVQFRLVDSRQCFDNLKQLAKELRVTEYIDFTGRVSDEELSKSLSSCDVYVNPNPVSSQNYKSTMNKILEYIALSRSIVKFNISKGRRSALEASSYAKTYDI